MKSLFLYPSLILLLLTGWKASAQVIDLRTGIVDGTNTLIAYTVDDDTWKIKIPGSSVYQPVQCGSGIPAISSVPYTGKDPNVGWLSLNVAPNGKHGHSPGNTYYYKTTFDLANVCIINDATLNLYHIGGDNFIDEIRVNGTIYPVNFGFGPWGSTSFSVTSDILLGVNEIEVRLKNQADSYAGIEINGNLTLSTVSSSPDASFCLSTTGSNVTATPNGPGIHSWEVYVSTSGNQGTYSYYNTFDNVPFLDLGTEGPCYLVKHTVLNDCGSSCESQSICKLSCDETQNGDCNALTKATNLNYNTTSHLLSWNAVPGALSYVIIITVNDQACCGDPNGPIGPDVPPVYIAVAGTSHVLTAGDLGQGDVSTLPKCFSWRVKAICENGSSLSDPKCQVSTQFGKTGTTDKKYSDENGTNASVQIFPNPAKGMVNIDIKTNHEVDFTISVSDAGGKLVKTFAKEKTVNNKASVKWNTESLAKGAYLVKIVTSDKQVIAQKLIIE